MPEGQPPSILFTFTYMPNPPESGPLPQEHIHTQLKTKIETVHKKQNDYIGFSIALGCLPEFKGKTLLLNTPHTLDTEFGGIMAN